jgi:DNA-binding NarL/FixJ family response regulator
MPVIRILLVHPEGLLRDVVHDVLQGQHDMQVVGQLGDQDGVADALARTGADLVVWGLDECRMPELWWRLFAHRPRLAVIAVDRDGREAALWRLEPRRTPLGELSPSFLVAAIREAAAR